MERRSVGSGTVWETRVGYARVVRVGDHFWSAGTLATSDDGALAHPGDAAAQTAFAFEKLDRALAEVGLSRRDVTRTRMYVLDIGDQEAIGRAHKAHFRDILPCATMVEVSGLALPGALVEVEVEGLAGASPA